MTSREEALGVDRGAKPTVTFVLPCYNERENISETIEEIEAAAQESVIPEYEILVVDDGSDDGTGMLVTAVAQQKRRVALISNARNLGFGGAYKEGVKRANGTYVIMVPGDNAFPRSGITSILRSAGAADIVIPYFSNPETRSWRRNLASRGFTFVINTLFGLNVPYFNGPVLHKTALIQRIDIKTNGFAYQAEALVKLITGGATYCGVPVKVTDRATGRSSAFALKNVFRVLATIFLLWCERYCPFFDTTKAFRSRLQFSASSNSRLPYCYRADGAQRVGRSWRTEKQ